MQEWILNEIHKLSKITSKRILFNKLILEQFDVFFFQSNLLAGWFELSCHWFNEHSSENAVGSQRNEHFAQSWSIEPAKRKGKRFVGKLFLFFKNEYIIL